MALARKKRRPNLSARERIVEAATKLFTERPFSEISADDIAREAGVAHGLTFHYFGSKAALYEFITQAAADRLDQIHTKATLTGSAAEKLRSFLVAHMDEVYRRRVDYVFHSRGGGTVQGQIKTKAAVVEMAFRLFPLAIANAKLLGEINIPSI
jgi:AcrR family transcriptional regulator